MNRAAGVYVFIAENEAEAPTLFVAGEGPLAEGPIDDSGCGAAEEGMLGVMVPGLGNTPLVLLDVPGSAHTEALLGRYKQWARKMAAQADRRVELVRFGDEGREHLEWFE